MFSRGNRFTVVCAVAAALLGIAGPASAGELSRVDAAGDVQRYEMTSDGPDFPGTVESARRGGDLRRFTVHHGLKRVTVVMRFRELTRRPPVQVFMARFTYGAERGRGYAEALVTATRENPAGRAQLTSGDCRVDHRIDYRDNRVRISFPTRCIGTPPWVRINPGLIATDDLDDPNWVRTDSLFPIFSDREGETERYTRRIYRG